MKIARWENVFKTSAVITIIIGVPTIYHWLFPSDPNSKPDKIPQVETDFVARTEDDLAVRLTGISRYLACLDAIALLDYSESLLDSSQTTHGFEGAYARGNIEFSVVGAVAPTIVAIEGNGKGPAALIDARANLYRNVEEYVKNELVSCQ